MRTLTLKAPPMAGTDVAELQLLLALTPADGVYGVATATAVYRKKSELGYLTPDHDAGDLLLAYLTGKRKPSAAMKRRAKARQHPTPTPTPTPTRDDVVRANCVAVAQLLIAHADAVHYPDKDVRTETINHVTTRLEVQLLLARPQGLDVDCSQFVTLIAHVAGALCPNGGYAADWAADGYTGTLLQGCAPIPATAAKAGDIRIYGAGTGHHAALVLEPGSDPLLASHGSERGPYPIRDSVERTYQPPGGTFLRLPI